jgi:hypothetical protein
MAKALQRILRIRQLAEEQARQEVERAAQRARQASAACARQVTLEHEQRTILAASWIHRMDDPESKGASANPSNQPGETTEEKGWLMEEATLEFFGWRRMRLEEFREMELRRMEPLIEDYTERRRELRQTEQLVEQRATAEAIEKNRRTQAETDEWFSQRTLMRQRRDLHRTEASPAQDSRSEARRKANESLHRQF